MIKLLDFFSCWKQKNAQMSHMFVCICINSWNCHLFWKSWISCETQGQSGKSAGESRVLDLSCRGNFFRLFLAILAQLFYLIFTVRRSSWDEVSIVSCSSILEKNRLEDFLLRRGPYIVGGAVQILSIDLLKFGSAENVKIGLLSELVEKNERCIVVWGGH